MFIAAPEIIMKWTQMFNNREFVNTILNEIIIYSLKWSCKRIFHDVENFNNTLWKSKLQNNNNVDDDSVLENYLCNYVHKLKSTRNHVFTWTIVL